MASPKMTASLRKSLPASKFGIPAQHKYPVDTRGRAANAKARATQGVNKGTLSPAMASKIRKKANAILGDKNSSAGAAY